MTFLASVQSNADASIPPGLVIVAVLALVVLVVAVSVVEIVRELRHASRVIDEMPLPEPTDHTSTTYAERSSR